MAWNKLKDAHHKLEESTAENRSSDVRNALDRE